MPHQGFIGFAWRFNGRLLCRAQGLPHVIFYEAQAQGHDLTTVFVVLPSVSRTQYTCK
jgi:hypothetical protein